jgi:hypothetical protein
MLLLKSLMLASGALLFVTGILVVLMDAHRTWCHSQMAPVPEGWNEPASFHWRRAVRYAVPVCLVLAPALGIVEPLVRAIIAP